MRDILTKEDGAYPVFDDIGLNYVCKVSAKFRLNE